MTTDSNIPSDDEPRLRVSATPDTDSESPDAVTITDRYGASIRTSVDELDALMQALSEVIHEQRQAFLFHVIESAGQVFAKSLQAATGDIDITATFGDEVMN